MVDGKLCVVLHNPWGFPGAEPAPVPADKIDALFHSVDLGSVK
jgi:hypothetical protein